MTRTPESGTAPTTLSPGGVLATMAAWGLATGYGELCYQAVRKYYQGLFGFQSPDVAWMTPLADAVLFASLGGAGWLIQHTRGRPVTAVQARIWAAVLAGIALLFLFPLLHKGAALLVALGTALALGRTRLVALPMLASLERFALRLLLISVAMTGGAMQFRRLAAERRAETGLAALPAGAPSVLVIILDTVRAWNLSLYGYPRPTTPNLARRAASGVRFTRAFATAPWTLPSHASVFTGREAHQLSTNWYVALDDSVSTLAEVFSAQGYRTGGFVANLPYTSRETGLDRGFAHYDDYRISLRQFGASASLVRAVSGNRALRRFLGTHQLLVRKHAPEVSDAFLAWVDRAPDRPFFAFLNYYDAHQPYVPPPEQLARFLPPGVAPQEEPVRRTVPEQAWDRSVLAGALASYDAAIATLDVELERLFGELERRGRLQRTLIVLASDHGEEFGEHGLIDHGSSLNRAAVEVPLILWFGDALPQGRVVDVPVSLRDIPATVADLVPAGLSGRFPGRSLRRFWSGGADTAADVVFSELRHAARQPTWYPTSRGDMLAIVSGGLRYIRQGDGSGAAFAVTDTAEARDLATDPGYAASVRALRAVLDSARPSNARP